MGSAAEATDSWKFGEPRSDLYLKDAQEEALRKTMQTIARPAMKALADRAAREYDSAYDDSHAEWMRLNTGMD